MVALLDKDSALENFHEENTYTDAMLQAHPLTSSFIPEIQALLEQGETVMMKERRLRGDIVRAQAGIKFADVGLDAIVTKIVGAILMTVGNDRNHPTYKTFMKNKTPSQIKSPILGAELKFVRGWKETLLSMAHTPLLVDLGHELGAQIEVADRAIEVLENAERAHREFRLLEARKKFIDETNAFRVRAHGLLAEMPHKRPELNLARDFGDQFFRPARKSKTLEERYEASKEKTAKLKAQLEAKKNGKVSKDAKESKDAKPTDTSDDTPSSTF